MTRTIIAGGGIVGLTAGRALLRAGVEVIVAVAGFEEDRDRVTVRFIDGSTEDADLLIGADGLYSKVRAQLFLGTDAQEHAGHRAWRAIVKAEHIGVPDDRLIVGGRHRTRGGYVRAPDGTVFWLLSQFGAPAPGRIGKGGVPYAVCPAHRWHLGLQAHRAH